MPHFIIECSENVLQLQPAGKLVDAVYEAAEHTGLFAENDIKVRLNRYADYRLGTDKNGFVHVFGYIMQGRSIEQRADLSKTITERLNTMLPELSIVSVNISEFEKATYCNKALLHPMNTDGNRHFTA